MRGLRKNKEGERGIRWDDQKRGGGRKGEKEGGQIVKLEASFQLDTYLLRILTVGRSKFPH